MEYFQKVFSVTTPLKVMKCRKDIGITKVADKEVYVEVFYNLVKNLPLTKTIGEFIPENIKLCKGYIP